MTLVLGSDAKLEREWNSVDQRPKSACYQYLSSWHRDGIPSSKQSLSKATVTLPSIGKGIELRGSEPRAGGFSKLKLSASWSNLDSMGSAMPLSGRTAVSKLRLLDEPLPSRPGGAFRLLRCASSGDGKFRPPFLLPPLKAASGSKSTDGVANSQTVGAVTATADSAPGVGLESGEEGSPPVTPSEFPKSKKTGKSRQRSSCTMWPAGSDTASTEAISIAAASVASSMEKAEEAGAADADASPPPQSSPPSEADATKAPSNVSKEVLVTTVSTPVVPAAKGKARLRELKESLKIETKKPKETTQGNMFRRLGSKESANDFYDFGGELATSGGVGGRVLVAKRRSDGLEMIVKVREKARHKRDERVWRAVMNEMARVRGNTHVLDIDVILEDDEAFYIVMPKCNGGELFDLLITADEIPERECKRILKEILIALQHLHSNGIIHRDIKPENILFNQPDKESPKSVKLIDFDTCANWEPGSPKTKTFVGTPGYIAPEVLLGEACPKSDLWSVGVIFYVLMTGLEPWDKVIELKDGSVGSQGAKNMYNHLKEATIDFDIPPWPDFPLARDLCKKLLAFHAEERPESVDEILADPWLKDS